MLGKLFVKLGITFVFGLLFVACVPTTKIDDSIDLLLEVEGEKLYRSDVAKIVPQGTSPDDSTTLADAFVRKWVTNVLLYQNAKRNVENRHEIEVMVEEYRKSLTIHYYQQRLVAQRVATPTDDEIAAFYEQYADQFPLEENIVQGIFLRVPAVSPQLDKLRRTFRKLDNDKAIQSIEDYCVKHAASYDYFPDKWIYTSELFRKMPAPNMSEKAFLEQTKFYETQDSTYIYMLQITDFRTIGTEAPQEFVREKIRIILSNKRNLEYIKQFETSLYDDAVASGKVKFHSINHSQNISDSI